MMLLMKQGGVVISADGPSSLFEMRTSVERLQIVKEKKKEDMDWAGYIPNLDGGNVTRMARVGMLRNT